MGFSRDFEMNRGRNNRWDRGYRFQNFTMFVGNLPRDMDEEWMAQIFSTAGNVIDVFIPKKRSTKQNWRFGFVRFASKEEGSKAIYLWNAKVIRDHKIFVKFARFACQWSSEGVAQKMQGVNHRVETYKSKKFIHDLAIPNGKNFVGSNTNRGIGVAKLSIKVFEEGNEWLNRSALAKLHPVKSLVFIQDHLQNMGYADVLVRPMGGDHVVLTFQSVDDRNSIFSNKGKMGWIKEYFQEIKKWEETTNLLGPRLVWLNCYGVPIHVWNSKTFSKLGQIWGDVILISDETIKQHSFTVGKVLVSTKCMDTINNVVSLQNKGINYDVKVVEEQLVVNTILRTECNCIGCTAKDMVSMVERSAEEDEDELENNCAELDKYSPVMKEMEDDGIVDVEVADSDGFVAESAMSGSEEFVDDSVLKVIKESSVDLGRETPSLSLAANSVVHMDASQDNEMMVPDTLEDDGIVRDSMCSSLGRVASVLDRSNGIIGVGATSIIEQVSTYFLGQKDLFGPARSLVTSKPLLNLLNQNPSWHSTPLVSNFGGDCNTVKGAASLIEGEQVDKQQDQKAVLKSSHKRRKKKKSIGKILGLPNTSNYSNGGRRKQKCVLFRSAVAAAAMSATTSGIENRNRILLNEAQTIWSVNKIMGLGYDGDEDEVISRIMVMEAQDQERAACQS